MLAGGKKMSVKHLGLASCVFLRPTVRGCASTAEVINPQLEVLVLLKSPASEPQRESPRWLLLTASGLSPDSDLQMNVDDSVVCLTSDFVPNNFLFYTNWLWVSRSLLLEVQVSSVCVCAYWFNSPPS